ncbi:HNH endonuclease signature motif containing protein [Sinomonas albida]|uniref:HNH endonuclease signature motif containing protein n=1 Tax=Sinomonas albida TaxID=369942 RepID=UPI0010A7A9EC|nr:HNH endonuclease signature motif containing protein [Sinomonas albida]
MGENLGEEPSDDGAEVADEAIGGAGSAASAAHDPVAVAADAEAGFGDAEAGSGEPDSGDAETGSGDAEAESGAAGFREAEPDSGDADAGSGPAEAVSEAASPGAVLFEARAQFAGGLVDTIRGLEEAEARIHAVRAYAVSQLCEYFRGAARDPLEAAEAPSLAAAEVAAALNVSQRAGRAMVDDALALADPALSPVLEALGAGRLDRRRARAVAEHAAILAPGKDAAFAEAAVRIACPKDPDRAPSPAALARRLRRLAEDFHSEPLAARKERAASFRRVDLESTRDGMCWISAYLPLEAGAAIDARLEALARGLQGPREQRGVSQLRADVFRDLLAHGTTFVPGTTVPAPEPVPTVRGEDTFNERAGLSADALAHGSDHVSGDFAASAAAFGSAQGRVPGPERLSGAGSGARAGSGVRMEVVVTVPARTLTRESETPGEILGYGPLDAEAARALAAEAATWTTMFVDPSNGAPLAVGRRRYTPSLAIRRFLGARDRTCRFPGCDKPAPATEADHTAEWQHGGTTDAANLALLCREHHRLKSLGRWHVTQTGTTSAALGSPGHQPNTGDHTPAGNLNSSIRRRASGEPSEQVPQPTGGVLQWTSPTGRHYTTYPETDAPPPF